ncbi:MAG: tRNA glutamyl-Q(34) synthetase GluQRS [Rhodospirillaceae bacterium]|nr:tRNA glutamyl-Q(34) synthetase GluQRS [Rhodospirillaceae bacterium]
MSFPEITRFAPSPTGYLHIGHAYAALFAEKIAKETGGRFILRIEDIDNARCKPELEEAIYEDLNWLGLKWEEPVRRQSNHLTDYTAALNTLSNLNLTYPCFCTRKEINKEIQRAGGAPHNADVSVYPGICKLLTETERMERINKGQGHAIRLNVAEALKITGVLSWKDWSAGLQTANFDCFGDIIIARKDIPTSYHLSVTVDDALQDITLVTRGEDLIESTPIHRLLQALLGYKSPQYFHHKLIKNSEGKRYAKRDHGTSLRFLRSKGKKPKDIRSMIGMDS